MMYYLLYWGVKSGKFKESDLIDILVRARQHNVRSSITGALIYCQGTFIQLLEGPELEVRRLFDSISRDERLAALDVVSQGNISQRHFDSWAMKYGEIDQETIAKLEDYPISDVSKYLKNAPAIRLLSLMGRLGIPNADDAGKPIEP